MDTGQVNQLAYYDELARTLRPALLVLVFVHPLPDYPIARIRTGQFVLDGDRIWMAESPVGAAEGAPSP